MQTAVRHPSININKPNDLFVGMSGLINVTEVEIKKLDSKNVYFLKLCGDVEIKETDISISVGITESDLGPLFVNKGKSGFFIYLNGTLRKLMDALSIADVSEFNGKSLPVANNSKGFWVISIGKLLENI